MKTEPRNPHRNSEMSALLLEVVSKWITRESNKQSMITLTSIILSEDARYANLGVSVIPESGTNPAITFLQRHASDIQLFMRNEMKNRRSLPFLRFHSDLGEKNRQKIDSLLQSIKEN
jgi:ribosome-binding factor A